MGPPELHYLTATEAVELFRATKLSPVEYLRMLLPVLSLIAQSSRRKQRSRVT
jgi:hypothetical protein